MVCVAMGLARETPVLPIFLDHLRQSGPIFGIMVFVSAQAVIFWRRLAAARAAARRAARRAHALPALVVRHRGRPRRPRSTDSLTGLKNRRAFEEDAGRCSPRRSHSGTTVALCLIDIDRFKQVNDRHGHLAGDAILEALARAIEATTPGRGYRLGGDEYGLLLEGAGRPSAEHAVADLQRRSPSCTTDLRCPSR